MSGFSRLKLYIKQHWLAATGLAVAVLAAIIFLATTRQPSAFAKSFDTDAYFEELIANQEFRRAAETIKIMSPEREFEYHRGEEIMFWWEPQYDRQSKLEIMNNRGEKLFTFELDHNQYLFQKELTPGLYYWRIEAHNDFRMDKFYVDKP